MFLNIGGDMIEVLHGQNQKYLGKQFSGDLWPSETGHDGFTTWELDRLDKI